MKLGRDFPGEAGGQKRCVRETDLQVQKPGPTAHSQDGGDADRELSLEMWAGPVTYILQFGMFPHGRLKAFAD